MKKNMIFYMHIVFDTGVKGHVARRKLRAAFQKVENTYGNGYYLSITSEDKSFEKLMDIRYEKFDPSNPEPFLANWAYSSWSGEKGSWDIASLKIERTTMPRSNGNSKKQLDANIIQ